MTVLKRPAWAGLGQRALLGGTVVGLATALEIARRLDARVGRAVGAADAVYRLQYGGAVHHLILDGRRVRARRQVSGAPDFLIDFVDLPGALARIARNPNDVLCLQLENKVNPSGNIHYLFQLGYLLGLVARLIEDRWPPWRWRR